MAPTGGPVGLLMVIVRCAACFGGIPRPVAGLARGFIILAGEMGAKTSEMRVVRATQTFSAQMLLYVFAC